MKKNIILTLIAIAGVAFVVISCVKDLDDVGISPTMEFTGTVVEKSTMQPIEGVRVQILNQERVYKTTETDANGVFVFTDVKVDDLEKDDSLLLDGTPKELPMKKESLKGIGQVRYDYKTIALYDKTTDLLPNVRIESIGNFSTSTALCKATVSSNIIAAEITERGFVWSTSQYPILNGINSYVQVGSGAGFYNTTLTGLTQGVTYYVRAYARNKHGLAYSEQKSFNLSAEYLALPTFTYNGHTYRVAPDPGNQMDWTAASSYCNNYSIGGVSGWRLPTRDELVQMYSLKNQIGGFYSSGYYWSSTQQSGMYYYYVYFGSGSVAYEYYSNSNRVRPIHQE